MAATKKAPFSHIFWFQSVISYINSRKTPFLRSLFLPAAYDVSELLFLL